MHKNKVQNNLDNIYGLINELSSQNPDSKVLKTLCSDAGVAYESDLVELMSKVLIISSSVSQLGTKTKKNSKLLNSEV